MKTKHLLHLQKAFILIVLALFCFAGLRKGLAQNSVSTGFLGYSTYDWQSNCAARTWTHVWPDGKVNFAFTQANESGYADRGTGIGTYDSQNNEWIPSEGRIENEKTGFGSIAQYGANGLVVAAHTASECCVYIIPDKDNIEPYSFSRVGALDPSHNPMWPSVMTSGPNRTIIHVIAGNYDGTMYYYRSVDGGQTWDKQNEILPFMGSEYCTYYNSNSCYWMETTDDNCLALVVNNPWNDGMVIYSYDDGETWERKVFYKHPNPFGSFEEPFYYPRWTSCQWDSQHHLHVLYEFNATKGEAGSGNNSYYPQFGGVAYWNETMPYNSAGVAVSAIEGNLVPGQPFVMDSAYLNTDIFSSYCLFSDASHAMWPEYIGYLSPLTDDGYPEDLCSATEFNLNSIDEWGQHGHYNQGICSFPVLCMVPGTDEMVAVWSALDENHTDDNGNYYYKIFASYSGNGGTTWSSMVHLTKDSEFDYAEFIYNQAVVVGRKLIIATQTDQETGTYVQMDDSDGSDNYYKGFVFDIDELFELDNEVETLIFEPFEEYNVGGKIAQEAIAAGHDWWTTWSNAPGSNEDGMVDELNGTQCGHLTYGNDQILLLGDEENGVYDLEFDILVPEGKNAYFNILHHFEGSDIKWALECYLHMTGSSQHSPGSSVLNVAGQNIAGPTVVYDEWMHFRLHVDTDSDVAEYYYTAPGAEETLVYTWQWSLDDHGNYYGRKMAAMDFYPSQNADNSEFYLDNFSFKKIGGESAPVLSITPESIDAILNEDESTTVDVTIANNGNSIGDWNGWIDFGQGAEGTQSADVMLHDEDVDYIGRIGYSTACSNEIAIRLTPNVFGGSAMGMKVVSAQYYVNSYPAADDQYTFRLYGHGLNGQPGEILTEKSIVSNATSEWISVTFDDPVYLTGQPIWLSVVLEQEADQFPLTIGFGCNGAIHEGDYISTNGGLFTHLYNSASNGAWMLTAHCEGTFVPNSWVAIDKFGGSIMGGQSDVVTFTFNSMGMTDGEYNANFIFNSNDAELNHAVIPVSLQVNTVIDTLDNPTGTLNGLFSVSEGQQVRFSQGNLQYIGSAGNGDENNTGAYWKFAEHQWDCLGDNGQGSDSKTVDRDLFGWGTSGYNHGAICYQPWSTSESVSDYFAYGSDTYNLFDQTGQADWGYNAISNGGNEENSGWRTLTQPEWYYLFFSRTTASGIRYAKAQVNNVNGVILLPDDWSADYYTLNSTNTSGASFSTNVITASQWTTLEQHGAVFLPAAGYRYGTSVNFVGSGGYYWSASCSNSGSAYYVHFGDGDLGTLSYYRLCGRSVRLVCSVENCSIQATPSPAEGGSVSGAGAYMAGAECTLTATPNEGYTFINWTENGEVVSAEATYTFTVTGNRVLVANFALQGFPTIPSGILNGLFSVNDGQQVRFSQGNLQYIGSAGNGDENNTGAYWKFAEHQWDCLGDNGQGSDSKTVDRDLFGWGTSGYNHGANCYQPWSTSTSYSDYYAYGNSSYNLNDQTGHADWGYNAISNGGDQAGLWRTLTEPEWEYLFYSRGTVSGIRYAKATVNNINGVILLPDDWSADYYTLNSTNTSGASFSTNVITASQWTTLEQHGAVFLPAAGYRYGTSLYGVGSGGNYWSASYYDSDYARGVYFGDSYLYSDDWSDRNGGVSVRLVCPAENDSFGINATPSPAEGGAVSGAGAYMAGAECTLTATPNEGYTFVNWTENGEVVSAEATYTFTVTGNRVLVANFALQGSPTIPSGILNGLFSVNDGQQVRFSQGNLQYIGSAGNGDENNTGAYWKFAEHQWDYLGDNGQGSDSKTVDRDLFGWGTSGYNHGAVCYQPWSVSTNESDYYVYGNSSYNLNDQTGHADWGYNAINNGGNAANQWRTLTTEEWNYLFNTRTTTSGIRYAKATVNSINGVILLPDDWSADYYSLNYTNSSGSYYRNNTITADQWATLEQHGAVFLPAGGGRGGTSVSSMGSSGNYWSASYGSNYSDYNSDGLFFMDGYLNASFCPRRYSGQSVRLVYSPQSGSYSINPTANPAEGGSVSGGGAYALGAECLLIATSNEGYTFVNWTVNGEVVSTDPTFVFIVTGANLVANFISSDAPITDGALNGLFSVSDEQQVNFSQGNLQYIGNAGNGDENNTGAYWKFAEHQWDYLGDNSSQYSSSQTINRDLFGWGTSGWNNGNVYYQPWSTGRVNGQSHDGYGPTDGICYTYDLTGEYANSDWGYNAISNGGNQENSGWRTLTQAEWDYLFNSRSTSSGIRYAKANVNNINGVILIPDDWDTIYYNLINPNAQDAGFSTNTVSAPQWDTLEQHGAVFLPAAGSRFGTSIYGVGSSGYYWSASCYGTGACYLYIYDGFLSTSNLNRDMGYSVRLVRSVENYSIQAIPSPAEGGAVSGAGAYMAGAECTLTATPNEGYTFVNWTENGEVVSTEAAYSFTVTGDRELVANFVHLQSTTISDGWTWYSTYLDGDGSGMLQMMEESLGGSGVMIKSHTDGFVSCDEYGWMGNLEAIHPESMYMVNATAPAVMKVSGQFAVAAEHPITLNPGWTWIGYPSSMASDLNSALDSYTAHDGDLIKMQNTFSQYVDGIGWTGAIETLIPGEGLMYYSLNSGATTLTYNVGTKGTALERNLTSEENHWVPNVKAYPYNMSVAAVVELDGGELYDSRYELAAFCGDECRGSVRLKYVAPIDRYVAFLTISGDSAAELHWALYDTETGVEYHDSQSDLHFEQNAILGAVNDPLTVRFDGLTGMNANTMYKVSCYPNPVDRNQWVRLSLPVSPQSEARVDLMNALGTVICSERMSGPTARIQAPSTAGVYVVRVTVNGMIISYTKLIVE